VGEAILAGIEQEWNLFQAYLLLTKDKAYTIDEKYAQKAIYYAA
jgi:Holliday junction resolvase